MPRPAKGSYKLPVAGIPPTPGGKIGPLFGTLALAVELLFFFCDLDVFRLLLTGAGAPAI